MPIEIMTNSPGETPTATLDKPATTTTATEPTVALETKEAEFVDQSGQSSGEKDNSGILWLLGGAALLFFMLKKKRK